MNKNYCIALCLGIITSGSATICAHTIHVSSTGSDTNSGTKEAPFLTISKAAYLAVAGDTVLIHGGTYREWVSPANGGISPQRRIVYKAVPGEKVQIKGSEIVKGWKKQSGGIWKVELSNVIFGAFNPFAVNICGDWLHQGKNLHLGEVYVNGKTYTESINRQDLNLNKNTWYAEVNDDKTIIYVNASAENLSSAIVEVNVRPTCFFPKTTGINYITVEGLEISQAATQWSPPTGEQTGIIGPNWSLGWIIRDCVISQSKCVGICLGKERASGQNMWSLYRRKFGYSKCGFNREIETIFKAIDLGWSKENIGSHLIENNVIHDCGQAGIVGHMGGAFSIIRNNEIYNINRTNNALAGDETGGIKLHAAIDTRIEHNLIYNTIRGIWLDWQAQGTHVVGNVIAKSEAQDLFLEVSHGPTLVYNNLFLSDMNILLNAQGVAFVNNLFSGRIQAGSSAERYTPYHFPHSTKVKGLYNNNGGDWRFYNNIFLGNAPMEKKGTNGLAGLNRFPIYTEQLSDSVRSTLDYLKVKFPVWTGGNVYYNAAVPYDKEFEPSVFPQKKLKAELERKSDGYYLNISLDETELKSVKTCNLNTNMLGQTFISECIFDNPDGTSFELCKDYQGKSRNVSHPMPGPFESFDGKCIWKISNVLTY